MMQRLLVAALVAVVAVCCCTNPFAVATIDQIEGALQTLLQMLMLAAILKVGMDLNSGGERVQTIMETNAGTNGEWMESLQAQLSAIAVEFQTIHWN